MGAAIGKNCDVSGGITGSTLTYCQSVTNYQTYLNVVDPTKAYH